MRDEDSGRSYSLWVLVLCLAVCLTGIFDRDLWTPDEPRDAAVALRMSRTGNLIVPYLGVKPFVEKPPLAFAASAGVARALGPVLGDTAAIRLMSALWGLGTLGMLYLLARRLLGASPAFLAVILLATMAGFVENFHWIRVDPALSFFVAAAVWSFGEFYFGEVRWQCVSAGLFTACSFLAKGPIGPALVGTAWLGMIVSWLNRQWRQTGRIRLHPGWHLSCLAAFALPAAAWMILFRVHAGAQLWNEWFWVNQAGRFSGTTPELGHLTTGDPLFYMKAAALYTLPWFPGILIWLWSVLREVRHCPIPPARMFPLIWIVAATALLSVSVTKREIYIAPLLPAFAMMCADAFESGLPKWADVFFAAWSWLAVAVTGLLALSPLWVSLLPASMPTDSRAFLGAFSVRHLVAAAGCVASAWLILRGRRASGILRFVAVTAILYVGLLAVGGEAMDRAKTMGPRIGAFASRIPAERRPRVVGWRFSETTAACFDYYCAWAVPQLEDETRLDDILAGRDPEFDSVIIDQSRPVPDLSSQPHRVLAEGHLGWAAGKRGMAWIEGAPPPRVRVGL